MISSGESREQTAKLKKGLKLRDLYLAAISTIFATAWILSPYYAAASAGPASIISWIIGGIFITLIAITWAEVGSVLPLAGGVARYSTYTHGKVAGAINGWANLLSVIVYPALETVALLSFIQAMIMIKFPSSGVTLISSIGTPTYLGVVVALLVVGVLIYINYSGIGKIKGMNLVANIIKLIAMPAAIIFIIAFGLAHGFGHNIVDPSFAPYGYKPILTIIPATGIVFAYLGFRQPIDMAAEAIDAKRHVARAILLAMATSFAIYTLLEVAFVFGLKWNSSAFGTTGVAQGNWLGLSSSQPMATMPMLYVASGLGLFVIAILIALAGLVGPPADAGQYTATSSRILFGMSRDGFIGKTFSKVSERYRIPYFGVIATFIVTAVLLLLGVAGYLVTSIGGAWLALTSIVSSTSVFAYMVGPLSMVIFRKSNPEENKFFKVKFGNIIAPVAFIVAGLMFYWGAGTLFSSSDPYGGYLLVLAILLGLILIFTFKRGNETWKSNIKSSDIKGSIWMIVFLVFTLVILYLGSYQLNVLPVPYDWITIVIGSAIIYVIALKTALPIETIRKTVSELLENPEGGA